MPWEAKNTMNLREDFVRLAATQTVPFSELCRRYQISRQTGYKWLGRYKAEGAVGLWPTVAAALTTAPCARPRTSKRRCWRCAASMAGADARSNGA